MKLREVPCRIYALHAENGDPVLLFGEDAEGEVFLWPCQYIERHGFSFARWSKQNVARWRGKRIQLSHPMDDRVRRWARWLGVTVDEKEARV